MISNATMRAILRWVHIVISIPILGYLYGPPAEVQQYAETVRFVFVPILFFSGFWMYSGAIFGIISVVALLGAYKLGGYGAAVLVPVVLLIARKLWLVARARR